MARVDHRQTSILSRAAKCERDVIGTGACFFPLAVGFRSTWTADVLADHRGPVPGRLDSWGGACFVCMRWGRVLDGRNGCCVGNGGWERFPSTPTHGHNLVRALGL